MVEHCGAKAGGRARARSRMMTWALLLSCSAALLGGCTTTEDASSTSGSTKPEEQAPDEETPSESEPEVEPEPEREEVAVRMTGYARARYTLALNKTTGISMEQTHVTPAHAVVFPAGRTSVARFVFADGRAVEMAVQRPHRVGGTVRFDGCVLRMNWRLENEGGTTVPCGEFVGRDRVRVLRIHESLDESVVLVVEESLASGDELQPSRATATGNVGEALPSRAAGGAEPRMAETIDDAAFVSGAWHTDGGQWSFVPSGLSVESVVRKR